MKFRLKLAVGGLALTGALVGGGAAAWAQTSTPSATTPSTTAPANPGSSTQKPDPKNCPNMGTNSGTGSAPAAPSGTGAPSPAA